MSELNFSSNPLVMLQNMDLSIKSRLSQTPDPKLAEELMEKKLKSIGLDDKEVAIMFMAHGAGYPLQKAMSETGLSKAELDAYYDGAMAKVNTALGSNSILGNVRGIFGK